MCLVHFLGSFGRSCSVCPAFPVPVALAPINATPPVSLHPARLSPVGCRTPKDTFIMHPYVGLEGQKSCSSLCQLIRKSIDQFAGGGVVFLAIHMLVSFKQSRHKRAQLQVNKELHGTHTRTGESCTPVLLRRACLSLKRDSVMREQSRHL